MQPTQPGWYWDPQGMPNLFRWWDGEKWTDHVSPIRNVGPPEESRPVLPGDDGRYHAGGLSCARLPAPWTWCPDYPHLLDGIGQQVVVGKTPRGDYIGSVFIGGLPYEYRGDDLDAMGTAFAADMLETFYAHETPHEHPGPTAVDIEGRQAWQLTVPLDVKDDHLGFAREDAVFVLVAVGDRPGVLYASLPDVPDVAMPTTDELIADLAVE